MKLAHELDWSLNGWIAWIAMRDLMFSLPFTFIWWWFVDVSEASKSLLSLKFT